MHRAASRRGSGAAGQRGSALVLFLGIMATLAILSTTMLYVLVNQMRATASDRSGKQSLYAAEAALDSAVQVAKSKEEMSTSTEWLTPEELELAFADAGFPSGSTVTFRVYDNLATIDYDIKWDQGGPTSPTTPDGMAWVESTCTHKGKTTRARVLVRQAATSFVNALPRAVLYSDTGITLHDTSDIYAVNPDGTPDSSGQPYPTTIMAGGSWIPGMDAELGRFSANSSTNLAAPGSSVQSLGIRANGSVSTPGHTFSDVVVAPGTVGFLSDYFDQATQADLADASQLGGTPAAAPATPTPLTSSGTSVATTKFTPSQITTIPGVTASGTTPQTYTFADDIYINGSLTLRVGTSGTGRFPAGTVFNFRKVSVRNGSSLTVMDNLRVSATGLYAGGSLSFQNTSATTPVAHQFGPVHSVGALSVTGNVALTTTSLYAASTAAISNTTSASVTHNLGVLHVVGNLTISGRGATRAASLYAGASATISGVSGSSTPIDHEYGLVYANNTDRVLTFSGNVQIRTSALTANGDFTITGATIPVQDWLGAVYVRADAANDRGTVIWQGRASVTSRDYRNPTAPPRPMWMGQYWERTGTYSDEYGPVWVPGNASTSVVFDSSGASSILCPILCTTEKTVVNGDITFGARTAPMVYYFMCDNNGIYPQWVDWGSTGCFYGVMVIMESTIVISGGDGVIPNVEGAVFAGCPYVSGTTPSKSDIELEGSSMVAYNQAIIDAVAASSIETTTVVTEIVPGSWQHLSASD